VTYRRGDLFISRDALILTKKNSLSAPRGMIRRRVRSGPARACDRYRARARNPKLFAVSLRRVEPGIFGRSRTTRRDVDETQKSLIYHVETRNAKIVARIVRTWRERVSEHATGASYRSTNPDNGIRNYVIVATCLNEDPSVAKCGLPE